MRRFTPIGIVARLRVGRALAVLTLFGFLTSSDVRAADGPAVPSTVAQLQSFRGRVTYTAHQVDRPQETVEGSLLIAGGQWLLEERSGDNLLHASNGQSWLQTAGQTLAFDDPLAVESLVNSWAVLLGKSAVAAIAADPSGASWTVGSDARIYLDSTGNHIDGLVDAAGADVSFAYADWVNVNNLWLPQSIVRLRGGATDASFAIGDYQVVWVPNGAAAANAPGQGPAGAILTASALPARQAEPRVWRMYNLLFAGLFLALCLVAWLRRDAFLDRAGRHLATDPRAWRDEGTTVFVSPEGALSFEGRSYRIGAAFFNRRALVQSSMLFIRVSAPGGPSAVVLARKFPFSGARPPRLGHTTAGFTLLEVLVATALFASVVVGAVFPALVVLARADRTASVYEAAAQAAANALADEEASLEYGSTIVEGSKTWTVDDGMRVTVSVSQTATPQLYQVSVQVEDAGGGVLARVATMVGPPVPPPAAGSSPRAGSR